MAFRTAVTLLPRAEYFVHQCYPKVLSYRAAFIPWSVLRFGITPGQMQDLQQRPSGSLADLLILQVPSHAVFEGELLQMQCRGWKVGSLAAVQFYRDGADITKPYTSAMQLSIPQAKAHHSGRYHCSADMHSYLSLKRRESQGLYISIKGEQSPLVFGLSIVPMWELQDKG